MLKYAAKSLFIQMLRLTIDAKSFKIRRGRQQLMPDACNLLNSE